MDREGIARLQVTLGLDHLALSKVELEDGRQLLVTSVSLEMADNKNRGMELVLRVHPDSFDIVDTVRWSQADFRRDEKAA